ncbi:MAG: hypothetical protein HOU81_01775 [Hamadaea sp.]|uniref:hypothetical protein n=1 Tax=Hamadaea sp. TaxID=2024425 RepID=UPI0017BC0FAC|nr:hypothetical protein [Hamadaea sp.]NUR69528.1 hypothetical protein [Hamadaea sp.]NUT20764.1 hypothetical protein [Hamadaea sp.]
MKASKLLIPAVLAAQVCVLTVATPAMAGRTQCQQRLTTLTLSSSTVPAGAAITGQVGLACKAARSGVAVALAADSAAAGVPASVVVPYGSRAASFTLTGGNVTADVVATVTATYGADSLGASVTVVAATPPSVQLRSLTVTPTSVTAGGVAAATVTLSGAAPSGGVVINLGSDNPVAVVPATVAVPAGATSAGFTIATVADAAQAYTQTVGLRAGYAGGQASAVLFVFPPAPPTGIAVRAVNLSAATVAGGGDPVTASVTLTSPAPADTRIYFYGSAYSPVRMSAQTVLIPAGQQSGAIQLFPGSVDADYTYTLTAEVQGTTPAAAYLVITP